MHHATLLIALTLMGGWAVGPALAQDVTPTPQVQQTPTPVPGTSTLPGREPGEALPDLRRAAPWERAEGGPEMPAWQFEEIISGDVDLSPGWNPWALGLGAIAGVFTFNAVSSYFTGAEGLALIGENGWAAGESVALADELAASRLYAVSSAVAGSLAGQGIYNAVAAE